MIQTIHLLHHTHTDYGYTDHPAVATHLFDRYTSDALALIEKHVRRDDERSRFRWNIEVSEVALSFWERVSDATRQQMLNFAQEGLLDLGAMPFHPHGFTGSEEWEACERRLAPVREAFKPRTAIINDVNGLAWGLIPRLLDAGVAYLSSGLNVAGGRAPLGLPRPGLFKWQGPDERWIWVWNSLHYCDGFYFFHSEDWRRGPIPSAHDPFYHPPLKGDIWRTDPEALESARDVLRRHLDRLTSYPYKNLGLQVTNLWRMDNDPPSELLCDFVSAWNEAGLEPQLRMSTFTQYLDDVTNEPVATHAPLIRGDWTNYWADGAAALPRENQAAWSAVRILADAPHLARLLNVEEQPYPELVDRAWHQLSMFSEHTTDAHDSVSDSSGDLSLGAKASKASRAYESLSLAQLALSDVIRSSPLYTAGRHSNAIAVVNPSSQACSDWIDLPIPALPPGTTSLVDAESGDAVITDVRVASVWSEPRVDQAIPYDRPGATFSASRRQLRAFIPNVPPGGRRLLRYATVQATSHLPDQGCQWEWDCARGELIHLSLREGEMNLITPHAEHHFGMGRVLFDTYPRTGARWALVFGDRSCPPPSADRVRSFAEVECFSIQSERGLDKACLMMKHPHCHRIEQRWLRHRSLPRIEIETTIWLKEILEPVVGAVAFPFEMNSNAIWYSSIGHPTRVGHDQLPGACGAYTLTEGVLGLSGSTSLTLTSLDSALMAFGELDILSPSTPTPPQKPYVFSIFACTRWMTNFPHVRPVKIVMKHRIDAVSLADAANPRRVVSLYAVPTHG